MLWCLVSKLLRAAIWSVCAVWSESEQMLLFAEKVVWFRPAALHRIPLRTTGLPWAFVLTEDDDRCRKVLSNTREGLDNFRSIAFSSMFWDNLNPQQENYSSQLPGCSMGWAVLNDLSQSSRLGLWLIHGAGGPGLGQALIWCKWKSYQKALVWCKWTRGVCSFPYCQHSFDQSVKAAQWYHLLLVTMETKIQTLP